MPRLKSLLVAAAILIGSVAVATFLVSLAPEPERQEPPSPVPFVQTAPVAVGFGAIPVFGAGTVRPSAEIAIAPQVGGRVVWVAPGFLSGGRVAAGQTLFRIEESDYVNRVREAEAELAARQVAFLEAQEEAEIARAEYGRYSGRQASDTPPEANALLDEQSRTIDVIVRVPDPFSSGVPTGSTIALDGSPPLLVGKFVEVEIQGLEPERFFRVRRAALRPGNEIWTVRDDETVSIVPVRVLQRGDDEIFVTGALGDGWPAIAGGIQFATNGMLVRTGSAPEQ